ncbi:MAG: Hsp20/alpha crystallin family protein [Gammaproteobacteria bacterium]|nr:Hsp20/alpha crystallin family protein [Gammaproteobacteria bacterium]
MSILRRDVHSIFYPIQHALDNTHNKPPVTKNKTSCSTVSCDWTPAIDIKEEDNRYLIRADIPGVKPDEIDVQTDASVVTITGERESHKTQSPAYYTCIERKRGVFYRRFSLPDNADAEKISAKAEYGVLEISIEKKQNAKPRKISVTS